MFQLPNLGLSFGKTDSGRYESGDNTTNTVFGNTNFGSSVDGSFWSSGAANTAAGKLFTGPQGSSLLTLPVALGLVGLVIVIAIARKRRK